MPNWRFLHASHKPALWPLAQDIRPWEDRLTWKNAEKGNSTGCNYQHVLKSCLRKRLVGRVLSGYVDRLTGEEAFLTGG